MITNNKHQYQVATIKQSSSIIFCRFCLDIFNQVYLFSSISLLACFIFGFVYLNGNVFSTWKGRHIFLLVFFFCFHLRNRNNNEKIFIIKMMMFVGWLVGWLAGWARLVGYFLCVYYWHYRCCCYCFHYLLFLMKIFVIFF